MGRASRAVKIRHIGTVSRHWWGKRLLGSPDSCARLAAYCSFVNVEYDISCGGHIWRFFSIGGVASGDLWSPGSVEDSDRRLDRPHDAGKETKAMTLTGERKDMSWTD